MNCQQSKEPLKETILRPDTMAEGESKCCADCSYYILKFMLFFYACCWWVSTDTIILKPRVCALFARRSRLAGREGCVCLCLCVLVCLSNAFDLSVCELQSDPWGGQRVIRSYFVFLIKPWAL